MSTSADSIKPSTSPKSTTSRSRREFPPSLFSTPAASFSTRSRPPSSGTCATCTPPPSPNSSTGGRLSSASSNPRADPMRSLLRLPRILHGTLLRAARHDCLNLAQSTAYSAMVSLFPALIVAAAVVSLLPDTAPLRFQLSAFFDRILPPDVSPLLQGYFFVDSSHSPRSTHALTVAFVVSLIGASRVLATLMEGVRRANELPESCWTFSQRRRRALLLLPLSLLPLALATTFDDFG